MILGVLETIQNAICRLHLKTIEFNNKNVESKKKIKKGQLQPQRNLEIFAAAASLKLTTQHTAKKSLKKNVSQKYNQKNYRQLAVSHKSALSTMETKSIDSRYKHIQSHRT